MKYNQFDVVELNNGDKATVIAISDNGYKVDIVDEYGNRKEVKNIKQDEIKNIIFKKWKI